MNYEKCGKMVVSLDFELQYGMEDVAGLNDYRENIIGVRKALPEILKLFQKYHVHATWAIVGMLLAENKADLCSYLPPKIPEYSNLKLSIYDNMEKIGENEKIDPYHYALEMVGSIKHVSGQEIGSHTFSHYYCLEKGQTKQTFESDLQSALKINWEKNENQCRSLVLPRNQINKEYLDVLKNNGIIAYRGCPNNFAYTTLKKNYLVRGIRLLDSYVNILGKKCYSEKDVLEKDICNIKASSFFRPYSSSLKILEPMKVYRIKKQMLYAAKNNLVFHMWWHPHNFGINIEENLCELEKLLQYYTLLNQRYGFKSKSMKEIAEEVLA